MLLAVLSVGLTSPLFSQVPDYTEEKIYQTRPDPKGERFFGIIGTTGLKPRVYPGVVLKVVEMMPGSPCEGKFAKEEILTGINGTALKGLNPFVAMGNALTKAEATDGKMVFDVTSTDGKTQRKELLEIRPRGTHACSLLCLGWRLPDPPPSPRSNGITWLTPLQMGLGRYISMACLTPPRRQGPRQAIRILKP